MLLTPRQQVILKAIVEDYVFTAEPVGSRALSRKVPLGISPATLRNEMADLELTGLLRQPHTSSGRIPSDAGYRFFVDALMERPAPPGRLPEEVAVFETFQVHARDLHDILQHAAKVTAVLSGATAIVRAPRASRGKIRAVHLLPISPVDLALVIMTDRGAALNQIVSLEHPVDPAEVGELGAFVNAQLAGAALDALTGHQLERLLGELSDYAFVVRAVWQRLHALAGAEDRVFVSNTSYLAEQPEFEPAAKIRALLGLLEREQTLASMLNMLGAGGAEARPARVAIGRENALPDLHECSVVSAPYAIGGTVVGELAVLGPTRMAYGRTVGAVETMAHALSQTLTRVFGRSAGAS